MSQTSDQSAKIEITSNLMVQDQGYMVEVPSLPNQAHFYDGPILALFFYRCLQFFQLTTVDIRINRLVPWKKLKKYHTFPIQPNR